MVFTVRIFVVCCIYCCMLMVIVMVFTFLVFNFSFCTDGVHLGTIFLVYVDNFVQIFTWRVHGTILFVHLFCFCWYIFSGVFFCRVPVVHLGGTGGAIGTWNDRKYIGSTFLPVLFLVHLFLLYIDRCNRRSIVQSFWYK